MTPAVEPWTGFDVPAEAIASGIGIVHFYRGLVHVFGADFTVALFLTFGYQALCDQERAAVAMADFAEVSGVLADMVFDPNVEPETIARLFWSAMNRGAVDLDLPSASIVLTALRGGF